ncbi:MAG: gamma-glutamyl-gamma-aminobutyrate hydrolase family protein [Candidatus Solibacter usitatus]|nr:gamma-glutamyl-gamma-aminobutyrate hydrolase family protein [Candidatus Solibacter usitatus]
MGQDNSIPESPQSTRPRVGVTFRYPEKVRPYVEAARNAGLEPVLILPDQPRSLDGLDGLLVTGGTDLNARLYGAEPHPANDTPDDERDTLERGLLQEALARDLPVLCICRGMQLFNVLHGGTLLQDMAGHRAPGVAEAHRIAVEPGTRLAGILDPGPHPVNSRHHQVVDQPGAGLRVSARSEDGYIEALERPDRKFALAVQWHPEDLVERHQEAKRLFSAFAAGCGAGTTP